MKIRKIMQVSVVLLVGLYISFVSVDCLRLCNSELGTKPFITIETEKKDNQIAYKGLGYTVSYQVESDASQVENETAYIEETGYGMTVWLFDSILLWGWVACG